MNSGIQMEENVVDFGDNFVSIENITGIALGYSNASLQDDADYIRKINQGAEFLDHLLKKEGVIYGVTTGYGDSCTTAVPPQLVEELPLHLSRFHGCGMGKHLTIEQSRAVMAVRLCSLTQGYSGVTYKLLKQIETFINLDIAPVIPEEGSVGASGDLTPLSYFAATLMGEREVYFDGEQKSAAAVLEALDVEPIKLRPKEGLALMNGTAVMTALACIAYRRAEYLCKLSARITSMMSIALQGNTSHFDAALFKVKPHPGQITVADWIRSDLSPDNPSHNGNRLQDRYSIRCAPHVIGVLQDSLPWMKSFIENELNSANDNPIIDAEREAILHGGHFYGGHIAMVMDSMKNCVANLADLLDRQIALVMDPKFNHGLPPNLSGSEGPRSVINHGFKAAQIGVSAWTAEALKLTMPASAFSRSTECHNQDKVSMGTIAARDCQRVLDLTEQVAAVALLASVQGIEIRKRQGELEDQSITMPLQVMTRDVRNEFAFLDEDRPLENELRKLVKLIQQQRWQLF